MSAGAALRFYKNDSVLKFIVFLLDLLVNFNELALRYNGYWLCFLDDKERIGVNVVGIYRHGYRA